jgi:hypothetical protein
MYPYRWLPTFSGTCFSIIKVKVVKFLDVDGLYWNGERNRLGETKLMIIQSQGQQRGDTALSGLVGIISQVHLHALSSIM